MLPDLGGAPLFHPLRGDYVEKKGQVLNLSEYLDYFEPLGSALSRQPDGAGRGDFSAMIHEAMAPGADSSFPVLPCGLEFLPGAADESPRRDGESPRRDGESRPRDGENGMPVWGDLLLLEILRRHAA